MADIAKGNVEIGLALQGGGALGAYECGAVTALLELMDEAQGLGRAVTLKCVAGVSIGAINAACVVGAGSFTDARHRLDALWDDLTLQSPSFWPPEVRRDLSLFGLPGFYTPRSDLWAFATWTSYYDTSPLIATLTRHVDFAALNASGTAFIVSAVDVTAGTLQRFRNRAAGKADAEDGLLEVEPHHVLASGSLPPQFPWTAIGNSIYWDGGIVDNTPLGDVIDAFSLDGGVDRLLIAMNLYPLRGRVPPNLPAVDDRLHELQLGNRMRQDHETARRINALVETIEEFAKATPPKDPWLQARLEEARRYKILDAITQIDFQDRSDGPVPAEQDPSDDEYGLRDFSPPTVARRRHAGYELARRKLLPLFANHGLVPAPADATPPLSPGH
jgi:predicted acylesterase/phospholipase RssA